MKSRLVILYFVVAIFSSCSKGYGTAYIQKNLTVYYTNDKDLDSAKKLADYWFDQKLIGNKPQTIRLVYNDKKPRQVQLLANEISQVKSLDFKELKALQDLENDLNKTVFKNSEIDVVICDSRFNVINDLNF